MGERAEPATISPRPPIAAIVVGFHPEPVLINRLIQTLLGECTAIYIMDNGGTRDAIAAASQMEQALHIVDMSANKGVGEALNRGFELAEHAGFDFVTTFDQDSNPARGQVDALFRALHDMLEVGTKIAAVGPRIVDMRPGHTGEHSFRARSFGWPVTSRCGPEGAPVETDFLITSGCLFRVSAFNDVGPFDEGLFVDCTDMEWCFRAVERGYSLFGVCSVSMTHELSSGVPMKLFGVTMLGYSAVRRYYYGRNSLHLCLRSRATFGWRLRILGGIIIRIVLLPFASSFARGWWLQWGMLLRGVVHGVVGVKGPLGSAGSRPA
jgi:rhamnosyltransferase